MVIEHTKGGQVSKMGSFSYLVLLEVILINICVKHHVIQHVLYVVSVPLQFEEVSSGFNLGKRECCCEGTASNQDLSAVAHLGGTAASAVFVSQVVRYLSVVMCA